MTVVRIKIISLILLCTILMAVNTACSKQSNITQYKKRSCIGIIGELYRNPDYRFPHCIIFDENNTIKFSNSYLLNEVEYSHMYKGKIVSHFIHSSTFDYIYSFAFAYVSKYDGEYLLTVIKAEYDTDIENYTYTYYSVKNSCSRIITVFNIDNDTYVLMGKDLLEYSLYCNSSLSNTFTFTNPTMLVSTNEPDIVTFLDNRGIGIKKVSPNSIETKNRVNKMFDFDINDVHIKQNIYSNVVSDIGSSAFIVKTRLILYSYEHNKIFFDQDIGNTKNSLTNSLFSIDKKVIIIYFNKEMNKHNCYLKSTISKDDFDLLFYTKYAGSENRFSYYIGIHKGDNYDIYKINITNKLDIEDSICITKILTIENDMITNMLSDYINLYFYSAEHIYKLNTNLYFGIENSIDSELIMIDNQ